MAAAAAHQLEPVMPASVALRQRLHAHHASRLLCPSHRAHFEALNEHSFCRTMQCVCMVLLACLPAYTKVARGQVHSHRPQAVQPVPGQLPLWSAL